MILGVVVFVVPGLIFYPLFQSEGALCAALEPNQEIGGPRI